MKEGLYWIRAKDIGPKAKNLPEMDTWHPQKENGGITLAPQKFSKGQPLEQDSFFIFYLSMLCFNSPPPWSKVVEVLLLFCHFGWARVEILLG